MKKAQTVLLHDGIPVTRSQKWDLSLYYSAKNKKLLTFCLWEVICKSSHSWNLCTQLFLYRDIYSDDIRSFKCPECLIFLSSCTLRHYYMILNKHLASVGLVLCSTSSFCSWREFFMNELRPRASWIVLCECLKYGTYSQSTEGHLLLTGTCKQTHAYSAGHASLVSMKISLNYLLKIWEICAA